MPRLAQKIDAGMQRVEVNANALAFMWLGQAGFVYKTSQSEVIYIDPYLTDYVERRVGFKRIMAAPFPVQDARADYVVCTHAHGDHMDLDAIPELMRNPQTKFVGPRDCHTKYAALDLPADRYDLLQEDKTLSYGGFKLTGVYADHGDLAPDALGVILSVGDIRIWHVGDSAYKPDKWRAVFDMGIDIIVPPINGAYGNLDAVQNARLAAAARAPVVIPCHFWMFAEHNGDPGQFVKACEQHAPDVTPLLLTQGEIVVCYKGQKHEKLLFTSLH